MKSLEAFLIYEGQTIRSAFEKIQENQLGGIVVCDRKNKVIGVVTDGDLRRVLLNDAQLDAELSPFINKNFVWVSEDSSREQLIKSLDKRVKFVPVLSGKRELVHVITIDNLEAFKEENIYACAKAPVRISFGGGGSDVTEYFDGLGGAVISASINLYSQVSLRRRIDDKIFIHSLDLGKSVEADTINELEENYPSFRLITSVIKVVEPSYGFELYINSDFPIGSGLGGSAAICSAILGCFNQFRVDRWTSYEIAELAFQAERLNLGVRGGWQDQYASVFGGVNFIEFKKDQNLVHPLRVDNTTLCELERRLILCYTGISHNSHEIHTDQLKRLKTANTKKYISKNVSISYKMKDELLKGNISDFGKHLDEVWKAKRMLSSRISTSELDRIYQGAIKSGALGGKVLGAGAGGFFLFCLPPFSTSKFFEFLNFEKLKVFPFSFDTNGLVSWSVRE